MLHLATVTGQHQTRLRDQVETLNSNPCIDAKKLTRLNLRCTWRIMVKRHKLVACTPSIDSTGSWFTRKKAPQLTSLQPQIHTSAAPSNCIMRCQPKSSVRTRIVLLVQTRSIPHDCFAVLVTALGDIGVGRLADSRELLLAVSRQKHIGKCHAANNLRNHNWFLSADGLCPTSGSLGLRGTGVRG